MLTESSMWRKNCCCAFYWLAVAQSFVRGKSSKQPPSILDLMLSTTARRRQRHNDRLRFELAQSDFHRRYATWFNTLRFVFSESIQCRHSSHAFFKEGEWRRRNIGKDWRVVEFCENAAIEIQMIRECYMITIYVCSVQFCKIITWEYNRRGKLRILHGVASPN